MSAPNALFDYIRDLEASGINGCSWQVVRLWNDEVIASGNTLTDIIPNTPLEGSLAVNDVTLGYPGPIKYRTTDVLSGITREHTSKSIGIIGPYRMLDMSYAFAMMLDGVIEGMYGELRVEGTDTTPAQVTVHSGICFGRGMLYRWPVAQTLSLAPGGAQGRIDVVVVRYYLPGNEQEGRIELAVAAGTPAATPIEPDVIQDDSTLMLWEVPLAAVQVDAGVNMIADNKVFDRRAFTVGPRLDSRYLRKDVDDTHRGALLITTDDGVTNIVYIDVDARSLQLRNQTDFYVFKGNGTDLSFGVDGLTGHLKTGNESSDRPTVQVHVPPMGAGATGKVEWGTDTFCEINLKAGTSGLGVGDLCTVVFRRDRSGTKYGAWLQPQNAAAAETDAYVSGRSVDGFHIFSRGPLKPGQDHSWMIWMGGAE